MTWSPSPPPPHRPRRATLPRPPRQALVTAAIDSAVTTTAAGLTGAVAADTSALAGTDSSGSLVGALTALQADLAAQGLPTGSSGALGGASAASGIFAQLNASLAIIDEYQVGRGGGVGAFLELAPPRPKRSPPPMPAAGRQLPRVTRQQPRPCERRWRRPRGRRSPGFVGGDGRSVSALRHSLSPGRLPLPCPTRDDQERVELCRLPGHAG